MMGVNEVHLQPKREAVDIIRDLGFEDCGYWFPENTGISFNLFKFQNETNILYAFVADDAVMYIGKSVQSLNKRMYQYKNFGPSQHTNIRNHANIKACLEHGQSVRIYAFIQQVPMVNRGIPINLAAGLEDNLISLLEPDWNKTGRKLKNVDLFLTKPEKRKEGMMVNANEIREFVNQKYIIPARKRGDKVISFRASDIHRALGLESRFPLVCSSIDAEKFLDYANVILEKREGPKQSSSVKWTFDLKS